MTPSPQPADAVPALAGRVVLVIGGAHGLGRSITATLARAGAHVALTSRDEAEATTAAAEVEALGGRASAFELDLRERRDPDRVVARVLDELGRIDGLVCNSGISGPSAPVWEVDDASWDEVLAVNLTGTFSCIRAVAPSMVAAGRGSIVVVGSMTGKRPLQHRSPYAASKLALVGLCRTLALDLGEHGVRINVVSPGFVSGARLDWLLEAQAQVRGTDQDAARAAALERTPLRRFTDPEDVAATVAFLTGDAAAGITGADVDVSSGLVLA
jgi:3-hydroxybutyrate dehydrogenase/3-oxoacyl-[acyl-carrier protein] reductase